MQLTAFTGYGLRCLIYMARQPGKLCTIREISEHYGVSHHHLVKIVHRMARLGYIESSKGKGGGIRLAPNAGLLKLGNIIRQLEPGMDLLKCFYNDKSAHQECPCRLKRALNEAVEAFIQSLNEYTLADTARHKTFFLPIADIGLQHVEP